MATAGLSTHVFGTVVESSRVFDLGDRSYLQFARVKRMLHRGTMLVLVGGQRAQIPSNSVIHGRVAGYITPPNLYRIPVLTGVHAMERKVSKSIVGRLMSRDSTIPQKDNHKVETIEGICELISSRPMSRGGKLKELVQAAFRR